MKKKNQPITVEEIERLKVRAAEVRDKEIAAAHKTYEESIRGMNAVAELIKRMAKGNP